MGEWSDWCEMREAIPCVVPGCQSRSYLDTKKCAAHSEKEEPDAPSSR